MIRALFNGISGVMAQQRALEQVSHNMANINTNGYKRSQASFSDLLYREMRDRRLPVYPTMGALEPQGGKGVRVSSLTADFSQGGLSFSGRELDLAINGEGFFRIIRADGTVAYTRNGSFLLDSQGRIVTPSGDFLETDFDLAEFMQIPDDEAVQQPGTLYVSPEGMAYWLVPEEEPRELGQVSVYRFVNSAGLMADRFGHYLETDASGPPEEGVPGDNNFGTIKQFYLEQSNVNLAEEMVELLSTQRALQSSIRTIMTADELFSVTLNAKQ